MSKIFLRHTLTKKFLTFSLYENASLIFFSAEQQIMTCSTELTTVKMLATVTDAEWWQTCIYNIWSAKLRIEYKHLFFLDN